MDRIIEQIGEPGEICLFIETYSGRSASYAVVNEGGDTLALASTVAEAREEADRIIETEEAHR